MSNSNPQYKKYENPGEALKELQETFNAWSEILTNHSVQAAYAVIAANWAAHGKLGILSNLWSTLSMAVILGFLGINLLVNWYISKLSYGETFWAENNWSAWVKQYEEYQSGDENREFWPYSKKSTIVGKIHRHLKCWAPFVATLFFVISLFSDKFFLW